MTNDKRYSAQDFEDARKALNFMALKDHFGEKYNTICGQPIEKIQFALAFTAKMMNTPQGGAVGSAVWDYLDEVIKEIQNDER